MKRFVIVSLMILLVTSLVLPQAKPGGFARQLALGASQGGLNAVLNPFIWDDPALVFFNPAYQSKYSDYMWANIAGGQILGSYAYVGEEGYISGNGYGYQNAGVAFNLSKTFTLGVILSYDPSAANYVSSLIQQFPGRQRDYLDMPSIQNVWEAIGTYRFTGMTLGLGVMYGWSNFDRTDDQVSPTSYTNEYEASSSVLGFRLGALMNLSDDVDLDITGVLRFDDATDRIEYKPAISGYGGIYEASGMEFQVGARAKIKMTSKFNFIPYAMFTSLSAEPKETEPPASYTKTTASQKYTATGYAFGLGGEYKINDFYFTGGLSWQHVDVEMDQKATVDTVDQIMGFTGLPVINLGGEWQVTDWLTGRIGYYRAIGSFSMEYKYPNFSREDNYSMPNSYLLLGVLNPDNFDGLITLGVGLHFGSFALDATVSEEALRRGIGLVGAADDINTFGYITASYNFGSK